jgi:hypothetical protein
MKKVWIATILIFAFIYIFLFSSRISPLIARSIHENLIPIDLINQQHQPTQAKTLVIYAYVEISSRYQYARTLKYFIDLAVDENDRVDFLFVIQGGKVSVDIPNYKNVKILKRTNDW